MKKEFNLLKGLLFDSNTYSANGACNWSEVSSLLEKLEDKIDEVEKRIDCAVRSSAEANKSISLYTERVDNNETFQMKVDDHDSILRGTNDVLIALDMNDTECIDNNWYWLFKPTEELKPIAVGKIEYDFPEEVYTIGNVDNTEIIGDVYESSFHELLDLGILVLEGSDDFTCGKANYIVLDNKFISIVKKKQIDLSKVPIKKEVFMTFHSSWGEIDCDKDGNVIEVRGDEEYNGERNYLFDIAVFDLPTYFVFLNSKNITMGEADDILAVGYWNKDNTYSEADEEWVRNIFGGDEKEDAPTMLCSDPTKHEIVNNIISQLKGIEVDGETMEYILRQVGMEEQMLKQLFAQSTNDEIDYLHDVRNGKG
jgi:hypothetical protein